MWLHDNTPLFLDGTSDRSLGGLTDMINDRLGSMQPGCSKHVYDIVGEWLKPILSRRGDRPEGCSCDNVSGVRESQVRILPISFAPVVQR